ncbi:MAG: HlyD family efflux transporter periplasmic adaptor subunit [Pirellulales bacterium]|nr:HlyD family efflux transporter periplasmic adaptor subunit [Pirellulales bacterium]
MTTLMTSPNGNRIQSNRTRMLAPAAYSEAALPSLKLARSSRLARTVGKLLFALLVLGTFLVALAPWQQSVKGTGNVIAYAPLERQQTIETPIKGRVVRLGEGVYENAHIREGELIAEVADIDTEFLFRLEGQLAASRRQVEAVEALLQANERTLDAAKTVVTTIELQVNAYELVKEQVIAAADAAVASAENKVEAERQQLAEHQAGLAQVQADFVRQHTLHKEKIVSLLKLQETQRKLDEAKAKVAKSEAQIRGAQNDLSGKRSDRIGKEQKAQADIESVTASLKKATADVAKAESDVAKAQSDLTKAQKDVLDAETKVARQRSQEILAPFDGFITRIMANQSSQVLRESDPICVIVPDTADRAVQVWLDGNDAPLVEPGRHVRLQFEGWPAVQFAGWPSVAVGTFGGKVISVDATDDGAGKFRVLVLPDTTDHRWPNERFLRQGVRANGWVLLDQVPLWYEIWRNMNGFPPVVSTEEPSQDKPPKLPKP